MGCDVSLTAEAESERDEVVEYLLFVLSAPTAARVFLDELDELVANLSSFPEMYPLSEEPRLHALGYRKALVGGYIVLYRVVEGAVAITNVFHESRDYARLV